MPNMPSISNTGLFGSFLSNDFLANVVLDAFQQRGLAKILAEPNLTTLTGQEAEFLSGGMMINTLVGLRMGADFDTDPEVREMLTAAMPTKAALLRDLARQ